MARTEHRGSIPAGHLCHSSTLVEAGSVPVHPRKSHSCPGRPSQICAPSNPPRPCSCWLRRWASGMLRRRGMAATRGGRRCEAGRDMALPLAPVVPLACLAGMAPNWGRRTLIWCEWPHECARFQVMSAAFDGANLDHRSEQRRLAPLPLGRVTEQTWQSAWCGTEGRRYKTATSSQSPSPPIVSSPSSHSPILPSLPAHSRPFHSPTPSHAMLFSAKLLAAPALLLTTVYASVLPSADSAQSGLAKRSPQYWSQGDSQGSQGDSPDWPQIQSGPVE